MLVCLTIDHLKPSGQVTVLVDYSLGCFLLLFPDFCCCLQRLLFHVLPFISGLPVLNCWRAKVIFLVILRLRLAKHLKMTRLEVLTEKGSAAVSCDANRTKTVNRTVEHMNSFLLMSITHAVFKLKRLQR